jgi:hypothetical protein
MNWSKLLGASIVTTLIVLSGCADNTGGVVDPSSPPATDAVISLVRTGGIAGIHDQLMVDKDGSWTTTDRAGGRRTGRLTDDQRATLRNLAADPRLAHESSRVQGPTKCADVYYYALIVNAVKISFIDCPTDEDLPQAAIAVVSLVTNAVWE